MTRTIPILILHGLLLPLNIYRLVETGAGRENLREAAS
jgi:hypothetical protein